MYDQKFEQAPKLLNAINSTIDARCAALARLVRCDAEFTAVSDVPDERSLLLLGGWVQKHFKIVNVRFRLTPEKAQIWSQAMAEYVASMSSRIIEHVGPELRPEDKLCALDVAFYGARLMQLQVPMTTRKAERVEWVLEDKRSSIDEGMPVLRFGKATQFSPLTVGVGECYYVVHMNKPSSLLDNSRLTINRYNDWLCRRRASVKKKT